MFLSNALFQAFKSECSGRDSSESANTSNEYGSGALSRREPYGYRKLINWDSKLDLILFELVE